MAKKYSGKTRRFGTVAVLLTVLTVVTVGFMPSESIW